jgi:hypothetical protein
VKLDASFSKLESNRDDSYAWIQLAASYKTRSESECTVGSYWKAFHIRHDLSLLRSDYRYEEFGLSWIILNHCKGAAQFTGVPAGVAMLVQVNAFPAGRLEACAPTNPTYGPNFVEMSGYGKVPTDNWNFNYFAIMHFAFIDPNKMARTSVVIIFEVFIFSPQTTKYQGKPHRPVEISSVFQAILKEASFRVFKTA